MSIELTREQEAIVRKAVAGGLIPSAEQFVSAALQQLQNDLAHNPEVLLGLESQAIDQAIEAGLASGELSPGRAQKLSTSGCGQDIPEW